MAGIDSIAEFMGWLSTQGAGTIGRDLVADAMPDESTGVLVSVFSIAGMGPHLLASSSFIAKPRFRVDVRSTAPGPQQVDYPDPTNARNRAGVVYDACLALAGTTLLPSTSSTAGHNWLFATPESEPFLNGRDGRSRVVYSFNVACERQGP